MRYINNRNLGITMPAIYTMRVLKHKCKRGWNKTYTSYSSSHMVKIFEQNIGEINKFSFLRFQSDDV